MKLRLTFLPPKLRLLQTIWRCAGLWSCCGPDCLSRAEQLQCAQLIFTHPKSKIHRYIWNSSRNLTPANILTRNKQDQTFHKFPNAARLPYVQMWLHAGVTACRCDCMQFCRMQSHLHAVTQVCDNCRPLQYFLRFHSSGLKVFSDFSTI